MCACCLLHAYSITRYAILGTSLFGNLPSGTFLNRHANFDTVPEAMLTLFRMITGEDWNGIMHDVIDGCRCVFFIMLFLFFRAFCDCCARAGNDTKVVGSAVPHVVFCLFLVRRMVIPRSTAVPAQARSTTSWLPSTSSLSSSSRCVREQGQDRVR